MAGAFIDSNNAKRNINPDVCRSPASALSRSLISGCAFVSQHGVFQVIDTFTCQVDAEQQSSRSFFTRCRERSSHGPADHTGESIYLQVRALPHCDFVVV